MKYRDQESWSLTIAKNSKSNFNSISQKKLARLIVNSDFPGYINQCLYIYERSILMKITNHYKYNE